MERELVLPEGVSSAPGRVRLWPYQKDIADAISDPLIERVTLVKSTRLGFTTLLTGAIGSFVANDPCPILCVLPAEADARDYMVSDVEPIFAASPMLRGAMQIEDAEEDRNTLLSRRFAGGSLKVVAARAPRNLRRHNARILVCDEADACESGPEGNPIRLAERRTLSFANRKIIIGSTPIFADTSHVLRAYGVSDQRVFEVPCPACGAFTEIMWQHIEWPPDEPQSAAFRCPHCQTLIAEREKFQMVAAGRWRITAPEVRGHAGFRANALISLLANASWSRLAAEFLAAKDDPAELQVFVNTVLAQGWSEAESEIDDAALAARAEPFGLDRIPAEVLVLTAGCDVQDDRIEISVCGWTREHACLVLGHIVIYGATDDETLWLELDELLRSRWKHPHGGSLRLDAVAIDAGDGDHFDRVCKFCAPRASRRVMSTKGAAGPRPAIAASHSKLRNGGRLWIVGTDGLKGNIFTRLARGTTIRFSDSLEPAWFDQLCSERRVVRYSRGRPVRRFERLPGKRAEALDCLVYATAARSAAPVQLDQRADDLRHPEAPPTSRPSVIKSRFMQ
jgi:phage terminase large subunit GpA-like protein